MSVDTERKQNNMANISYKASGRKNSKKNPAILHMNIDGVKFNIIYTKKNGWMLDENASEEALNAFCEYISLDKEWNNYYLQNYINAYYNQVVSYHREAVLLKMFETHSQWRYSFGKEKVEILWWSEEKDEVNA
jgi:hypothetical protein